MVMPFAVLTLFNTAALSRFARASVLDNLSSDYVRTARSKGLGETRVVTVHGLRNSIIPVIGLARPTPVGRRSAFEQRATRRHDST